MYSIVCRLWQCVACLVSICSLFLSYRILTSFGDVMCSVKRQYFPVTLAVSHDPITECKRKSHVKRQKSLPKRCDSAHMCLLCLFSFLASCSLETGHAGSSPRSRLTTLKNENFLRSKNAGAKRGKGTGFLRPVGSPDQSWTNFL